MKKILKFLLIGLCLSCLSCVEIGEVPGVAQCEAAEQPKFSALDECPKCANSFSVGILPQNQDACYCIGGYITFETDTGTVKKSLSRSGTAYTASTGFNTICQESAINLCLWYPQLDPPFCQSDCLVFTGIVGANGITPVTFPACFQISPLDTFCLDLGTVHCCKPGTANTCIFDKNKFWASGLTACENCTGTGCS